MVVALGFSEHAAIGLMDLSLDTKRNVNCEAKILVNTNFFVLRIIKEVIVLFSIFISVYLFDNRERRGGDD